MITHFLWSKSRLAEDHADLSWDGALARTSAGRGHIEKPPQSPYSKVTNMISCRLSCETIGLSHLSCHINKCWLSHDIPSDINMISSWYQHDLHQVTSKSPTWQAIHTRVWDTTGEPLVAAPQEYLWNLPFGDGLRHWVYHMNEFIIHGGHNYTKKVDL